MIRFVHWLRIRSSLWTIIWTRSSRGLKIRKFHFFNFESSEKISPRRIEIMIGRNEGSGVKVTISGHVIELVSRDKVGSCDEDRDHVIWGVIKFWIHERSWNINISFSCLKKMSINHTNIYINSKVLKPSLWTLSKS